MEGLLWQIEKRRAVAMDIGDWTSAAEPKTADEVWWDLQCNQTQKWRKFAGEMTGHAYLAGEDNEAIIGNYAPNVGATAADVHGLQHEEWNRCATESHDMDPCVGSILHSALAIPAEELMDGAPEAMIEKTVERRRKRLMKNRESAARSRARKLAYTTQLESAVTELKAENARLKADQVWKM